MTGQTSQEKRGLKSLPAVGAVVLIGVALFASQAAFQPANGSAQRVADAPPHTVKAVAAADKFLKGLDDTLRAKAVYDFGSDKRSRWSNLPNVPRNGVRIGELSK